MAADVTVDLRRQVLDLLRRGRPINEVCNQTGLLPAEVQQIANDARKTSPTLAGKPHESRVVMASDVLTAVQQLRHHESKKIASLASRLHAELLAYEEKGALLAKKARLERELAAVCTQLRGGQAKPSASTRPTRSRDWKAVRAWCAANGVPCSEHGALPKAAVEAYDAAHPQAAA